MYLRTSLIALLSTIAAPLAAQSVTGATAEFTYHSYDETTLTSLQASGEFAINPTFGLGAGFGFYEDQDSDDSVSNLTARAIYFSSPQSAFGLFYARDNLDDNDLDALGLEWGYGSEGGRFEAYYGGISDDSLSDDTASGFGGLTFEFRVYEGVFLTFASEAYAVTDGDTTFARGATSIGARYQFAQGPAAYAEFGQSSFETTNDDVTLTEGEADFIGFGAEYNFGGPTGALLSNRTIAQPFGF